MKKLRKLQIALTASSLFANQMNTCLTGALTSTIFSSLHFNFWKNIFFLFVFLLFVIIKVLGIDSWVQPLIWLVGPICGLLQPFFGNLSDKLHGYWINQKFMIAVSSFVEIAVFILFGFIYRSGLSFFLVLRV